MYAEVKPAFLSVIFYRTTGVDQLEAKNEKAFGVSLFIFILWPQK